MNNILNVANIIVDHSDGNKLFIKIKLINKKQ